MKEHEFIAAVRTLAERAHAQMMRNGMNGIYTPISVLGVTVTCADDLQSVKNRFLQNLRRTNFADITSELKKGSTLC